MSSSKKRKLIQKVAEDAAKKVKKSVKKSVDDGKRVRCQWASHGNKNSQRLNNEKLKKI